jgi:hypothetical protein
VQGRLIELMTNKRYAEFKRYTVHEADVRLIASADLSLEGRVKAGLFLPKLFFTLCKSSIELNETCGSRERVLGVIDLLRAEVMPGAAIGGAQSMDWWMKEGCSAAQTPASAFLREVVTSVARRSRGEASAEEVLVATMHEMSRIASERGRVERETSPREDAVRRRDYSRHPDVAMTIFNSKRALEGGMGADRRIAVGD